MDRPITNRNRRQLKNARNLLRIAQDGSNEADVRIQSLHICCQVSLELLSSLKRVSGNSYKDEPSVACSAEPLRNHFEFDFEKIRDFDSAYGYHLLELSAEVKSEDLVEAEHLAIHFLGLCETHMEQNR